MFEGRISAEGHALGDTEAGFGADGLRPLGWGELVARLAAARDFRRVMRVERAPGGSFDGPSARQLAALGQGQRGINPFALTNGKMGQGNEAAVSIKTETGDRGRQ